MPKYLELLLTFHEQQGWVLFKDAKPYAIPRSSNLMKEIEKCEPVYQYEIPEAATKIKQIKAVAWFEQSVTAREESTLVPPDLNSVKWQVKPSDTNMYEDINEETLKDIVGTNDVLNKKNEILRWFRIEFQTKEAVKDRIIDPTDTEFFIGKHEANARKYGLIFERQPFYWTTIKKKYFLNRTKHQISGVHLIPKSTSTTVWK